MKVRKINFRSHLILISLIVVILRHIILTEAKKQKVTTTSTTTIETPDYENEEIEADFEVSKFETGWDSSSWNQTKISYRQILIGSFNMKKFGMAKVKNEFVLESLVKIVIRYDLIAVTEITDRTGKAIKKLMERVNFVSEHPYHYLISARVGRTNNKEQYVLIYRPDVIRVKNHFLYDDSEKDPFAREPLIAQLLLKGREKEVALVSIHVKPTDAVAEINALADVQHWIENRLKIKDVIILGDFNADCGYVPKKAWKSIKLRNEEKFFWLIGDEVDTTVGKTHCAYDRIVIVGSLRNSVISESAKVFAFDREFNMDEKTALQVSDHYPVEVSLRVSSATRLYNLQQTASTSAKYLPYIYGMIGAIRNYF